MEKNPLCPLDILAFLQEMNLNYFAFSFYDNKTKPRYSLCTNAQWLQEYKHHFLPKPPLQPYILQEKHNLIVWDIESVNEKTQAYLDRRKEVCETKAICTLLLRKEKELGVISLGSPYHNQHILNVFKMNKNYLSDMCNLFLKQQRLTVSNQTIVHLLANGALYEQ